MLTKLSNGRAASPPLTGAREVGRIEPCRIEDIPAVADLHSRAFYQTNRPSSAALQAYYRRVFFENPWCDEELPSLVYRSTGGGVLGFIGVVPRRMLWNDRPIRVAVAHRLMVSPDSGVPLAAAKLVKTFFAGPQDLSISDGANDSGRKFWEGLGGRTAPLYSVNWVRPLRPCRYLAGQLWRGKTYWPLRVLSWPVFSMIDWYSSRVWEPPTRWGPLATHEDAIGAETLHECIIRFSGNSALRPQYDRSSLEWLLARLRENEHRGRFEAIAVLDRNDATLGVCLFYVGPRRVVEVVLLAARGDSVDAVFRHLLQRAWRDGATAVFGRVEPKMVQYHVAYDCLLKRGCWALIHSRNRELLKVVEHGDAFLSGLEAELWLRSPKDRL